jgi:hypothetical protein
MTGKTEYLEIGTKRKELKKKFRLLKNSQLSWFEAEAKELFELKRLPTRTPESILQQILGKSPNDADKKARTKDYYISNTIGFLSALNSLLTEDFIEAFGFCKKDNELLNYNYHRLVQHLLLDSLVMLNEYSVYVANIEPKCGVGKSNGQHTLTLYQSLRQSIYGQSSFHSFREVEPDLSITIIRQLVELRVRRAFGILGWYDSSKKSLEPLAMSKIFEVLKNHESDIEMAIPLSMIVRINGWSNIFLHSGFKEYGWKHILVTEYLKQFSLGKSPGENGFNVNSGFSTTQATLDSIVNKLESGHPSGAEVIRCTPELVIKNGV